LQIVGKCGLTSSFPFCGTQQNDHYNNNNDDNNNDINSAIMKLLMASQRRLGLVTRRNVSCRWNNNTDRNAFSTRVQEAETFLNGTSSLYAEQMHELYLEDPSSVHESWRQYFDNDGKGISFDVNDYNQPTSIPGKRSIAVAGVCFFLNNLDEHVVCVCVYAKCGKSVFAYSPV
jgi:hypothetical protein